MTNKPQTCYVELDIRSNTQPDFMMTKIPKGDKSFLNGYPLHVTKLPDRYIFTKEELEAFKEEQKTDPFDPVFHEVLKERHRQDEKWGEQNHEPTDWCTILGEEVGEVNKAVFEAKFQNKPWEEYRTELIQVAAVAISMVQSFDRNKKQ